jgi:anthranilate/para-aminobenzoate synthase component II
MRLLLLSYELASDDESLVYLHGLLSAHQVEQRQTESFEAAEADGFEAVLLLGRANAVDCDSSTQQELGDWLAETGIPVLACGWGFGIMLSAYGFDAAAAEQVEAATTLIPTEAGSSLFQGTDPLKVEPSVRWSIDREDLPKGLQILASSDTGIEALRHKKQPKFGIQLLPTDFTYPSDAKLVYGNLFTHLEKSL